MLKTFLKPGWVLMLIFVIVFSWLCFTVFAPWQLGKDDDIVERNEQITAAYEADPEPVDQIVDEEGRIRDHEWSRALITGHYLPDDEVLLRLRPVASGPSYQSLVPFETTDGQQLLINRGWLPAEENNAVPDIEPAPTGEVTLVGMVRRGEATHPNPPIEEEGFQQVYSVNTPQVSELTGTDLGTDYFQLSDDNEPGVLNPMPIPQLERGNHLSYGYQWIAFGFMAPMGFAYFIWSEIRERRRARNEEAELSATAHDASADSDSTDTAGAAGQATSTTDSSESADSASQQTSSVATAAQSRRQRSRYGDSKPDYYAKMRERRRER
ncbi:SURF1 family protein [Corynebacterium camporealensis]|uniref:SURF1 family cytochrome oxidase biogenesis protein n=1 Tax=Corynebacterium camporealensis TaxID=161896 RepID=UPI0034CD48EB